jgi:hypothetical protein
MGVGDVLAFRVLCRYVVASLLRRFSLLQHRPQLRHPHGEAFTRYRFDVHFPKGVAHEAMAITVAKRNVGDCGELPWELAGILDALRSVSQQLGVGGGARHRQRVDKTSRAVPPVAVVDAHGIAGEGKLRGAHGFLQPAPKFGLPEYVGAVAPQAGAASQQARAPSASRDGHSIGIQPGQFQIQVVCLRGLGVRQPQSVAERLVPLVQYPEPLTWTVATIGKVRAAVPAVIGWCNDSIARRRSREAAFEIVVQGAQQTLIRLRVQSSHAVEFLFDQTQPPVSGLGSNSSTPILIHSSRNGLGA